MSQEEIEKLKKLLEDWEKMSAEWERVFIRDEIWGCLECNDMLS